MSKKNEKDFNIKSSSLLHYYESLKNFPPLSKEEERVLLKRYKENNDIIARQKLITSNLRYALKYVIKYNQKKNVPIEDLIEEANIGLIKAVDEFNLSNENRIICYANWKMLFSLQEATKSNLDYCENDYIINTYKKNDDEDDLDNFYFNTNFNDDNYDDDYNQTLDYDIEDSNFDIENDMYTKALTKSLMCELNEREYDIISMYFGINKNEKEYTLSEIGEKHGITKERVRQIIEKCKRKMRIKAIIENKYYA